MNSENVLRFLSSVAFLIRRFKATDIPGSVSKGVPDFCTVYVISKGKISLKQSASRPAPAVSPLRNEIMYQASRRSEQSESPAPPAISMTG